MSLRLHTELEAVQKKSLRLEWQNEELRERLQNLEVAKQVLQAEMNKSREVQREMILSNCFFAWTHTPDFENIFYIVQLSTMTSVLNVPHKVCAPILLLSQKVRVSVRPWPWLWVWRVWLTADFLGKAEYYEKWGIGFKAQLSFSLVGAGKDEKEKRKDRKEGDREKVKDTVH